MLVSALAIIHRPKSPLKAGGRGVVLSQDSKARPGVPFPCWIFILRCRLPADDLEVSTDIRVRVGNRMRALRRERV